jgi:hypothetical protein
MKHFEGILATSEVIKGILHTLFAHERKAALIPKIME